MKKDLKTDEIENFVKNSVYLAKERGTLREFESYCGLSPGYFSRRRKGTQKSFSLQSALLVCDYLGRPLEDLLNPKLRHDLEAKRIQEKMELIEQQRLSLTGGADENTGSEVQTESVE